jgi:hypothetical protein
MSDHTAPPRDTVIRAFAPAVEFRSSDDINDELGPGYIGLLRIRFSPVNEWTEINSAWEGRFMERFAPGAWKKTIKERAAKIRALFQHFGVVRASEEERPERSDYNPHGIKEVTITEARLHELGPVTFPAYEGATSGMRSMTDEFILSCFRSDPDRLREMFARATDLAKPPASEQKDPAPSAQDDAAPTGTSTPERRDTPSKGRYGLSQHPPRPSWAL